jgi:hypothetical protein
LVYTDRATEFTVLRDLAWSPDGNTLALLVAPPMFCDVPAAWPRLVALRVAPDEAVRAETLNIYDDWVNGCALPHHFHIAFPFAWSPDGTRIAVTKGGGIVEISAENGDVLARHSGEGLEGVQGLTPEGEEIVIPNGPLVWLPKR